MALLARVGGAVSRVFRPRAKEWPGGFVGPIGSSGIPKSWPWNFWQLGHDPLRPSGSAVVYACRQAYAQTISMCPGTHWVTDGKGGRERSTTSALSRILRRPNSYQSPADFWLYLTDCLYADGAAFGLALRNDRYEIAEIHLMDPTRCGAHVASNGELFYSLGGNVVIDQLFAGTAALDRVPARDVLHIRLPDRRNPLKGCAPLEAALLEIAVSNAMVAQALAYASNQGRPSGVLELDEKLESVEQLQQIRASWNEQTQGVNAGNTPILTGGLKWSAAVVNSRDAQLAEMLQISDQRIATAYRVPLSLLSLSTSSGPQGSTESHMAFWISTGLGPAANLIEDGIGRLFALRGWPDDYLEFDLEALLRANFRDRIEGLARGVQGGIFSPNEARAKEDLPAMPFGDEPRVQQQIVPLSAWDKVPEPTPRPDAPPAAPPAEADAEEDDATDAAADAQRAISAYRSRRRLAA